MFRQFPYLKSLFVAGAVAAMSASAFAAGISAEATMSYSQISPGVYDYQITVTDTGTTAIGTFWFSWIPGAGFMPAAPSSESSPAGWVDALTNGGKAIQWKATTDLIEPGDSLSGFSFDSTVTPEQFLGNFPGPGTGAGDPILTTTVYAGAPLVGADDIFVVTETPEPGTLLLTFTGLGLAAALFASRRLRERLLQGVMNPSCVELTS